MTTLEPHPLCLCVPPNSAAKRKAILDSIKADPANVVVTLYEGKILDGRTRYELCLEAGIEFTRETFHGTDADAAKFVADQLRPRRDLNATQRAEAIERLCETSPEYQTWIAGLRSQAEENAGGRGKKATAPVDVSASKAAAAGVSRRTQARVQQARAAGSAVSDAMLSGELTARAAEKPPARGHKVSENGHGKRKITGGTSFNVEELESEIVDGEGNAVPERCAAAFRECEKFDEAARLCSKVKSLINELAESPARFHLSHQMAASDVTNSRTAIVFGRPHKPCPRKSCGESCDVCKGAGYLTKDAWNRLPAKERK